MPAEDETRLLSTQEVNLTSNGDPDIDDGDENDPLLRPSLPRHSSVVHGPPADPWRISYWIMAVQGASMLLPWNVFITAKGFFQFRFAGSPYEDNFQNYFSVAFMGTNLLVVGSSILIQKQAPGTTHIIGSLLLNASVFLAILVSIQMERDIDSTLYFYFAISMLSLSAISTSIVQNGMFGLASKFTGHHVQGVMLGQGLVGAGVAASQIVAQILSAPKGSSYLSISDLTELGGNGGGGHRRRSEGLEHSAFMFFSVALGFTLVSILAQALLIRLPIYDYYTSEQALQPIQFLAPPSPANGLSVPDPSDERRNSTSSMASAVTTVTITPAMIAETNRRLYEEALEQQEAERVNHYRSTSLGATALATDASAMQLMQDIYPKKKAHPLLILYISITLVFALTLSLFPSLTALVESTNEAPDRGRVFRDLFVPLHFFIYNLGDWAGKVLPSFAFFAPNTAHPTRKQQWRYLAGSLARFVFIPIFLTANLPIKPEGARLLPLLIRRDEIWFLLMFLFAISNGYLGSLIMMVGPACVLGGEKKGRAGVKLGFWLTAGLALGSVASFGVRELMCARGGCSA